MTTTRKKLAIVTLCGLALVVFGYFGFYVFLGVIDGPERAYRHMKGEPVATQDVNDAADWLSTTSGGRELETIADGILEEFSQRASELPRSLRGHHPVVPLERLPQKFWRLGGTFTGAPEVVLDLDKASLVTAVVVRWGNGRHKVIIFADPRSTIPTGFHVRKVTARIYVVANES